jgi:cell division protein FtsI (penicillin-binding protein 3)
LAQSSNVGTLKIAQKLGPQTWYHYEKLFGVGIKTGIELPGESSGYVPPLKDWSASTFANLPFGQGESMTVLQLASIYQTVANNGVRIPPRIVQSVTKSDGSVTTTAQPKGIKVVDASTAKTLRTMLESVTLPGGTAPRAQVPGYRVAGKTGTAHKLEGHVYVNKYVASFVGFAPVSNPRLIVAVMIDEPSTGDYYGGGVAAPVFSSVMGSALRMLGVPTDAPIDNVVLPPDDAAVREET